MRYAIWDHAGKAVYLRQQLVRAGHVEVENVDDAELLLIDHEGWWAYPRPALITAAHTAGVKVAVYPHGGLPIVFTYDGQVAPDPRVDMRLEHGPGSIKIAERLGLALKQQATGWLFSPTRPFTAVRNPTRVLFAPQHPNMELLLAGGDGYDPGPAVNHPVYRRLLTLGYDVTVSYVGPMWKNGIWPHPGVRMVGNQTMLFHQSWQLVQDADVVVAAGTVAATAVASGKPTVMFGQDNLADYIGGEYQQPLRPELYVDDLLYPLDAEHGDLADLIEEACAGSPEAAEWRERFVGNDGTSNAIRLLEDLTMSETEVETTEVETDDDDTEDEDGDPVDVAIQGVTATAGVSAGANEEE